jgi:GTPase
MSKPVVAIVGRPNVGKSTLFNRILGSRLAVVHDEPGITRDRLSRAVEWGGYGFQLVDTGGWVPEARETMDAAILDQVLRALTACELILFVVDARAGLHPHDREIAQALFRQSVPVLLVANKTDSASLESHALEFTELGFPDVHPVSASEGLGVGDLLEAVVARLPERVPEPAESEEIRIALVGRPNVGKSSLVNRLLQEERMIVDERPGTTRDAVDSPVRYHGRTLMLVDTAGIRRRLDHHPAWEFYATLRALKALDRAHVAVLVLDASEPVQKQDARIAEMVLQSGAATVVAVNKWDLPEKDTDTSGRWIQELREGIPFLSHAPVEFVSAKTAQRIHRLPEACVRVYDEARRQVATSEWNAVLKKAMDRNPPSAHRGQRPAKIYYATQVRTAPPTVSLFVSEPTRVAEPYLRYLNGAFREALGFEGSPIRIVLRKS